MLFSSALLTRDWTPARSGLIIAIISVAEQVPDSGSTKERLLDAAARVIARDGFQGARLADVAREAGLTTGAVYSNFRDKEELFLAAFEHVQDLGVDVAGAGGGLEGILTGFRRGLRQFE